MGRRQVIFWEPFGRCSEEPLLFSFAGPPRGGRDSVLQESTDTSWDTPKGASGQLQGGESHGGPGPQPYSLNDHP